MSHQFMLHTFSLRALRCGLGICLLLASSVFAQSTPRLFTAADINAVREVDDPQLSPEGDWVAYTVRVTDTAKDKRTTHVWMSSWDGQRTLQLTHSEEGERMPRWSPDKKFLAFVSSRGSEDGPGQVWLLDRRGGEAQQLTSFEGDVLDYDWSPDGSKLAVIVLDPDPAKAISKDKATAKDANKTTPPLVIDRFYFKVDNSGYQREQRQHLYLFDVQNRRAQLLTPGKFDESGPSWSPDGTQIAFLSKRTDDPDRNSEFGLYTIGPVSSSEQGTPKLLTTFEGETGDSNWTAAPAWSPDGKQLAVLVGGDPKLIYYSTHHLALVAAAGGNKRILTTALDRNILQPRWSADGKTLYMLVEDDLNQHLAKLNVANGKIERVLDGRRRTGSFDLNGKGRIVVLDSTVNSPDEVFALAGDKPRALSRQNDVWLASVKLANTEPTSFNSKDGTRISGFIVTPPDYVPGRTYPTLLWVHGGPVSQFANTLTPAWQIFAASGYVVVSANPRGSSGRGEAFSKAIYADWGNKDSEDVLAAVDNAVAKGIADPQKLGVGGWSYGGILTNNLIARDTRFKAATSGASIGNVMAGFGTDMYVREYIHELGTPWTNLDVYLRNSYPFLHADRIKTPTLFLCGERDFNVPLLNSEQMYQALRVLGIDTQLIIYPEQFHGLRKPSYLQDRMQRYLDWYGKYLLGTGPRTVSTQ
jgi:dipeptidyl aminopeptidase/acylaminoacyl peptidase